MDVEHSMHSPIHCSRVELIGNMTLWDVKQVGHAHFSVGGVTRTTRILFLVGSCANRHACHPQTPTTSYSSTHPPPAKKHLYYYYCVCKAQNN
jgi:hypothetical protein